MWVCMGGLLCVRSIGCSLCSWTCLDTCIWATNPWENVQTWIPLWRKESVYGHMHISYISVLWMVVDGDTWVVVHVTESMNKFSEPMWVPYCASLSCLWVGVYMWEFPVCGHVHLHACGWVDTCMSSSEYFCWHRCAFKSSEKACTHAVGPQVAFSISESFVKPPLKTPPWHWDTTIGKSNCITLGPLTYCNLGHLAGPASHLHRHMDMNLTPLNKCKGHRAV